MSIIELKNENEINGYLNELDKTKKNVIAIDLEAEFNLHCYGEHLCLIQIFDRENELIIDPFKIKNSDVLKRLLEKRDLLKIMYDSGSDAALLKNEYDIIINSVLDLRPAVTLLNYPKQSLSNILSEELGIIPSNKKKFQCYNWMRRPIAAAALEYAMNDVRYLFDLKDKLFDKLKNNALMDAYILHNLMIQNGTNNKNKKEKYEKAKGYDKLDKSQKNTFKKIFIARDAFAKKINKPPHYVFSNGKVLALCKENSVDDDFIEEGINPRIKASIRNEIFTQFASIIKCRPETTDTCGNDN